MALCALEGDGADNGVHCVVGREEELESMR